MKSYDAWLQSDTDYERYHDLEDRAEEARADRAWDRGAEKAGEEIARQRKGRG